MPELQPQVSPLLHVLEETFPYTSVQVQLNVLLSAGSSLAKIKLDGMVFGRRKFSEVFCSSAAVATNANTKSIAVIKVRMFLSFGCKLLGNNILVKWVCGDIFF